MKPLACLVLGRKICLISILYTVTLLSVMLLVCPSSYSFFGRLWNSR